MNRLTLYRLEKEYIAIIVLVFCIDLVFFWGGLPIAIIKSIMILASSICMLSIAFNRKRNNVFRIPHSDSFWPSFYLLLSFLTLRLINDFIIFDKNLFMYGGTTTLFLIYTGTIILPAIFFSNYLVFCKKNHLSKWLGIVLFIVLGRYVLRFLMGYGLVDLDLERGTLSQDIILLGHFSVSLYLIGLYSYKSRRGIQVNLLSFICCIIGILGVAFAGERGPFVAAFICSIISIGIRSHMNWSPMIMILISLILFIVYVPYFVNWLDGFLSSYGIESVHKINDFITYGVSETGDSRLSIYAEGWNSFLESPITGSGYLLSDGSYVHNLVIESFMAMGVLGGICFLYLNYRALIMGYKLVKKDERYSIFLMLFIQYFVFGLFSAFVK